jgi:hypothetical protein
MVYSSSVQCRDFGLIALRLRAVWHPVIEGYCVEHSHGVFLFSPRDWRERLSDQVSALPSTRQTQRSGRIRR